MTQQEFDEAFESREVDYPDDCFRIIYVAMKHMGLAVSIWQAEKIWRHYSDTYAAGWLIMDRGRWGDEQIVRAIKEYVEFQKD